jgi:hypothetical protein
MLKMPFSVALVALLLLPACTEGRASVDPGVQSLIRPVTGNSARATVTAVATPGAGIKQGNGTIAVSLTLPPRSLLATVDDITRITLTLRRDEPGAVGAIGTQEIQRAQMLNGSASLRFNNLVGGQYAVDVTAWDIVSTNIGAVSDHVQVQEGTVATLSLRLQLVSGGQPPLYRPSPLPSGPNGELLPPTATPATPRPLDVPPPVTVVAVPTPFFIPPAPTPVPPVATAAPQPVPGVLDYNTILADGVSRQLAYPLQQQLLLPRINALAPADRTALDADLAAAKSETEQIFILKAIAANEAWRRVSGYADTIRGLGDAQLVAVSMMHNDLDLMQQWQDSCGPSIVEVAGGEYDPLYSYQLHALYQVTVVDPLGVNAGLAGQQKQWLEAAGGIAVQRGQNGGKPVAIDDMLNQHLSPITNASYTVTEATGNPAGALETIANDLRAGYAVPLRVIFVAENYGHFIVALAARGATGQHDFLIHDSVSGKTAWVSQANILAQNFNAFFNEPVGLTHYYQPTAK